VGMKAMGVLVVKGMVVGTVFRISYSIYLSI
jgi:hypothetical protein